jgi:mannose-6-phosphate isomerase-like protein (cupin superfamily)
MKPTDISQAEPVLVPENAGTVLNVFGDQFTVKLAGQQTQSAFTLLELITPPGGGPPPHYHVNDCELFMLQEGRVSYFVQDRWTELGPGGVVFVPRGSIHTFRNVGDVPARQLGLVTPSGAENAVARCAAEFAKPGGPDMKRILEISAEYGTHFVEASTEAKKAGVGVKFLRQKRSYP